MHIMTEKLQIPGAKTKSWWVYGSCFHIDSSDLPSSEKLSLCLVLASEIQLHLRIEQHGVHSSEQEPKLQFILAIPSFHFKKLLVLQCSLKLLQKLAVRKNHNSKTSSF